MVLEIMLCIPHTVNSCYQSCSGSAGRIADGYISFFLNLPVHIDYMYISFSSDPEWTICYIADYDSGKYYYVSEESENEVDIYDYKTGELKSKANPSSNSN